MHNTHTWGTGQQWYLKCVGELRFHRPWNELRYQIETGSDEPRLLRKVKSSLQQYALGVRSGYTSFQRESECRS